MSADGYVSFDGPVPVGLAGEALVGARPPGASNDVAGRIPFDGVGMLGQLEGEASALPVPLLDLDVVAVLEPHHVGAVSNEQRAIGKSGVADPLRFGHLHEEEQRAAHAPQRIGRLRLVAFEKCDEQCLALDIAIDGVTHMTNRTPSLKCISTKTAADTSPTQAESGGRRIDSRAEPGFRSRRSSGEHGLPSSERPNQRPVGARLKHARINALTSSGRGPRLRRGGPCRGRNGLGGSRG